MIDLIPNQTLLVQMGIFLFALAVMHFLIFRPVLRILDKRRALGEGARKDAAALDEKTEGLVSEYTRKMQQARDEGLSYKTRLTKEGEEQAKQILAKGRDQMESKLEQGRQEVQSQAKEAQLILRKYSRDLSEQMAEKLLGRKVSG